MILVGVFYLNTTNGTYITGPLAVALGFGTHEGGAASGKSVTSSEAVNAVNYVTSNVGFTVEMSLSEFMSQAEAVTERVEAGSLPVEFTRMTQSEAEAAGYTWVTNQNQLSSAIRANQNICLGADIGVYQTYTTAYSGTLDGNGYTLEMHISTDAQEGQGLFAQLSGATIKNLKLTGEMEYLGYAQDYSPNAGLLAASAQNSTIDNIVTSGHLEGDYDRAGGLLGGANNCTISNVYSDSYITAEAPACYVGGIVGYGNYIHMQNVYFAGTIYAYGGGTGGACGGIIGYSYQLDGNANDCTITNAYNCGSISGGNSAGGIFGENTLSIYTNCINTNNPEYGYYSSVYGKYAGGIGGKNTGKIYNVYNAGNSIHSSSDAEAYYIVYSSSRGEINYAYNSQNDSGSMFGNVSSTTISNIVNGSSFVPTDTAIAFDLSACTYNNIYYNDKLQQEHGYGTAISEDEANAMIQAGLDADYSNGTAVTDTITTAMTTTDTLGQLGLAGDASVMVWDGGASVMVTISPEDTVQDMLDKLSAHGVTGSVSGGKLTLNGDDTHYIQSMTDSLEDIFKIQAGQGFTYDYSEGTVTISRTTTSTISVKQSSLNDVMNELEHMADRAELNCINK